MPRMIATMLALLLVGSACAQLEALSMKPISAKAWNRDAAQHLLRRAAFGGTPAEIDRLASLTLDEAVDMLVDYERIAYTPAPPPIPQALYERPERRELSPQEREQQNQQRREMERAAFEEIRLWWIERMCESPRPFEEMMTLFWHGRFTSGMREVKNAVFMKEQNEFLRKNALGNFQDLLEGVSRDRAMLVYLDGARNHKTEPNENYARELMELFTLGTGAYSERDIKEGARAFTGWGFDEDGFRFRERDHDYGPKTFLGRSGKLDGDDVIEIILQQPACSRFLARKLLEFYVRPSPDRKLIEGLTAEIRRRNFELKPVMKALLKSEAFYHTSARGTLVKSPVTLLVGAARSLGAPLADLRLAERAMAAMGQELMQPPNVKGWDGGPSWINTATLFTRYNTITGLIEGFPGRPGPKREPAIEDPPMEMQALSMHSATASEPTPRSRREGGRQPSYDATELLRGQSIGSAEEVVDFYANHLLAVELPEAKRAALVQYLEGGARKFDVNRARERIQTMVQLMCATPEFQLY